MRTTAHLTRARRIGNASATAKRSRVIRGRSSDPDDLDGSPNVALLDRGAA